MQHAHECGNIRLPTGVLIYFSLGWPLRLVPVPYVREPHECSCRRRAIFRNLYTTPCLAALYSFVMLGLLPSTIVP